MFQAVFDARPLSTVALGSTALTDLLRGPIIKEDIIVSAVKDGKGQLWVGTLGGGIRRIAAQGETLRDTLHLTRAEVTRTHPETGTRTVVEGARAISNIVLALATSPDGALWAATAEGVSRIQEEGNALILTYFSALDGLGLPVRDVKVDAQGIVWLATDGDPHGGLFRILPQGGSVQGRILDSAGQPVGDADVLVQGTPFLTVTDAEGHFLLATLPLGLHQLRVIATQATGASFLLGEREVVVTTEALILEPLIAVSVEGQ